MTKIKSEMIPLPISVASADRKDCVSCGLFTRCTTPFMRPYVPVGWSRKFLGVGEAPGEHEDVTSHSPFTGPAGSVLWTLVNQTGMTQDFALTNAVICRPIKNATPTMKQIRACRPFLLYVIETLHPENIIAFGDTALRALRNLGNLGVTEHRGRLQPIPNVTYQPRCWATYHPAACLYPGGVGLRDRILRDLGRTWDWLPEPQHDPDPTGDVVAVDTEYSKDGGLLCVETLSAQ